MNFSKFLLKHLTVEEKPFRLWLELGLLVLLLHIWALSYFMRPSEPATTALPVIMEVSLMAAPAQKKTDPPSPEPVIKQTSVPKKAKQKPVIKKPSPRKPRSNAPRPEPIPAALPAKPEQNAAASPAVAASPAAAVPKAAAPKNEIFTEANFRANYAFNPKPNYPRIARTRGWQGKVLLKVRVSAAGYSESVAVHQSSGHETLDESAVEAVKKWKFVPARRGDAAVASSVIVPIQFTLHD
ncbi:MAG: TonB family protein [Gammaproteobacteria bacterium]